MIAILPTVFAWYNPSEMELYNLNKDDIALSIGLSLASLCFYSGIGYILYGHKPKRFAWYISAVNSCTMLAHSIYYIIFHVQHENILPKLNPLSAFESRDNFSVHVCIWFLLANFWDVCFGLIFYPEALDPLTAYIHHSVFIWICFTAITGNGIFIETPYFSRGLLMASIEELPTCILSLGYLQPAWRSDLVFGITFFLFRIVFHSYIFYEGHCAGCCKVAKVLYTMSLVLHIYWFTNWWNKYGRSSFLSSGWMPLVRNIISHHPYEKTTVPPDSSSSPAPPSEPATPMYTSLESKSAEEIAREDEELSRAAEAEALQQLAMANLPLVDYDDDDSSGNSIMTSSTLNPIIMEEYAKSN